MIFFAAQMLKVFRDPIHGNITLKLPEDQVLLDLIDTPEFQRLRRISQLGTSYLTYHGAEHSRLTHSIGVLHVTTLALAHLIDDAAPKIRAILETHRQVTRIAALLHDIGHGPYSHTFEHLSGKTKRHETWGSEMITGKTSVHAVLVKHGFSPKIVSQILEKKFPIPLFAELLSGHVDCDRMDYLLRDSHATGVKYGVFDWQRIIASLTTYMARGKLHLGVTPKGRHVVEEFVLARYFMYEQVYLHKTVQTSEFLLTAILKRARDLVRKKKLSLRQPGLKKLCAGEPLTLNEYISLDDHVMSSILMAFAREPDPILHDLADRFLSRKLLKSQVLPSGARGRTLLAKVKRLAKRAGFDPNYYVGILDNTLTPYPPYEVSRPYASRDIMVVLDGKVSPISKVSPLIRQFEGKKFRTQRVCFPEEIKEQL